MLLNRSIKKKLIGNQCPNVWEDLKIQSNTDTRFTPVLH
jgi:hypothetical protein